VLVFLGRPLPAHAVTAEQLTERWIAAAREQWTRADPKTLRAALLHALGLEPPSADPSRSTRRPTVVLASGDERLESAVKRAGFAIQRLSFTPFDGEAAAKVEHFETYNRTAASERAVGIALALRRTPHAILIADGDAGLPALLALAAAPADRAIVDVGHFDGSSDEAFQERLYIPGIRRAGDLRTALASTTASVLIHNAGTAFELPGATVEQRALGVSEIVARLKRDASPRR
jgi:hypothetical protein